MNILEQCLSKNDITYRQKIKPKISDNEGWEIDEKKEIREESILKADISFKSQGMDVESILNSLKRGDFILPKYQRRFVWDKEDISMLVLSLVKNIPIPPMYLYFQNNGRYVILDGQQRITSIFMYFNSIFFKDEKNRKKLDFEEISREMEKINPEIEKKFNLEITKYNIKNNDVTFDIMNSINRRILLRKPLDVVFVQCTSEEQNKVYSDIFKLLNSAGKPLSNQEIRNGIYIENTLYDEIERINQNKNWRVLYGNNSYIYRDFEYLLRFLSLNYYTEIKSNSLKINYNKNFDYASIIDDFSEKYDRKYKTSKNNYSKEELDEYNDDLLKKVKEKTYKLERFFESITINKKEMSNKKMSILILEAIFVAYCQLELYKKDIIISYEDYLIKLDNKKFKISRSTSSKSSVEERINVAYKLLQREF